MFYVRPSARIEDIEPQPMIRKHSRNDALNVAGEFARQFGVPFIVESKHNKRQHVVARILPPSR